MHEQSFAGNYFFRGLKMLWHPKLCIFVIMPILINIVLFILVLIVSIHYFDALVHWLLHFLPHWLAWLSWLLWLLFVITGIVVFAYLFTLVSNIIGAPFNGLLAEKVQALVTGKLPSDNTTWQDTIKDIPREIGRAAKALFYYLPRALICLILLFIPFVQTVVPILWFIFNAWMMSVQYLDYPMDNNKISFHDMLKKLSQRRLSNLSFGCCVLIGTMIPVINLIVMPAAVIGATLFWLDQYQEA